MKGKVVLSQFLARLGWGDSKLGKRKFICISYAKYKLYKFYLSETKPTTSIFCGWFCATIISFCNVQVKWTCTNELWTEIKIGLPIFCLFHLPKWILNHFEIVSFFWCCRQFDVVLWANRIAYKLEKKRMWQPVNNKYGVGKYHFSAKINMINIQKC